MKIEPITLTGRIIQLQPLSETHIPDLALVGLDERIWHYMLYGEIKTEAQLRAWVLDLLERQARGGDLPFAVIDLQSGRAIGATRYMNIDRVNRNLEIGGTWYGLEYQGTGVNTEAKYLLLKHAFERLGCLRVQLKTDLRNERSQRAIERIGATKEGVLRKHLIRPGGYVRDSVIYSMIDDEWPAAKARLEARLEKLLSQTGSGVLA
ncbi:MAG: GNAT family N-acetyltransferase [Anaerolineales bacterium]|nr:GNAT family N-acetyltransferase [Anaerolineales bacterium]